MKTAKIGALFLVALMALTGVSAGYAMWYDDLTINGTVNTGTFNVNMVVTNAYDNEADNKDVSHIGALVDATGKIMTVTLYDAYPCITYAVEFDLVSTGTVPAHFTTWNIVKDSCIDVLTITPLTSVQLHQGQSFHVTLTVHLNNDALEDHTTLNNNAYTFTITTQAHQYNEGN